MILLILAVLLFSVILCIVEIPEMIRKSQYRELLVFGAFLVLGNILTIFKSLNMKISNPSDWILWVYSPLKEFLEGFLE